jgi:hypothetical protein
VKYIKEYNEHGGGISISDIENCFIDIIDKDIHFKVSRPRLNSQQFSVSINLNDRTQPEGLSEYGVRYRAVIDGKEITEMIIDGISKCEGFLDLNLLRVESRWVNAGEWLYTKKKNLEHHLSIISKHVTPEEVESLRKHSLSNIGSETGPGMLERMYINGYGRKLSDNSINFDTKLDMSEMENDILSKGDRLREVDIYFSVKK